ncbi:MAG: putative serine protease PepD, partial [Solirubrobacteraceae bacterium]|nr:putative serine protease PepD [Solirubrobacteraceae bacterium]
MHAGQVIGIVDQIATGGSGVDSSTGVGFAVPSNIAKAELGDLERGSTPAHAYLGVGTAPAGANLTPRPPARYSPPDATGRPGGAAAQRPGRVSPAVRSARQLGLVGQRKFDAKRGPCAGCALDAYPPAERFHTILQADEA